MASNPPELDMIEAILYTSSSSCSSSVKTNIYLVSLNSSFLQCSKGMYKMEWKDNALKTNLAVYQDSPQTPQWHHPTNLSESHNVKIKQ